MANRRLAPITRKQLALLQDFIAYSKDGTDFGLRMVLWLLKYTQRLTCPVYLSVPNETFGAKRSRAIEATAHGLNSANGHSHLYIFLRAMGTKFYLSHAPGLMVGEEFDSKAEGNTIWWSPKVYDRFAKKVALPTKRGLQSVGPKRLGHLEYHRVNSSGGGKCHCLK